MHTSLETDCAAKLVPMPEPRSHPILLDLLDIQDDGEESLQLLGVTHDDHVFDEPSVPPVSNFPSLLPRIPRYKGVVEQQGDDTNTSNNEVLEGYEHAEKDSATIRDAVACSNLPSQSLSRSEDENTEMAPKKKKKRSRKKKQNSSTSHGADNSDFSTTIPTEDSRLQPLSTTPATVSQVPQEQSAGIPAVVEGCGSFPNKCSLKVYLQELLSRLEPGQQPPPEAMRVLVELFTYHPRYEEKLNGQEITHFTAVKVAVGRPERLRFNKCFGFHRADGTHSDFSIIKCLDYYTAGAGAKARPTDSLTANTAPATVSSAKHLKYVRDAMNVAVREYKQHFINQSFAEAASSGQTLKCPYTDQELTLETAIALATQPTIQELRAGWAQAEGLDLRGLKLLHGDNRAGNVLADATLKAAWQEYYKLHANLRLVSEDGHKMYQLQESLQAQPVAVQCQQTSETC